MVVGPREGFARRLQEALKDQEINEWGRGAFLAKVCHVSGSAALKWLSGEGLPHLPHTIQIAEKLGVCVEWLLTGRGPKKPPSPNTVAHMDTFDRLAPTKQVTIQEVADAFVKSAQLIPWKEGVSPDRRSGRQKP